MAKRRHQLGIAGCVLSLLAACTEVHADTAEPPTRTNVLILGDSISIGYTPVLQGLMATEANVRRPTDANGRFVNCQGTTLGIKQLDHWLGDTRWDVIHFNFGLHDLKYVDPATGRNSNNPEHGQQANVEQYEGNLRAIVKRLKQTGAKLVFATTTPFPDRPSGPLRRASDAKLYNEAALRIMKEQHIAVNDLHGFVAADMEKLLLPNNVHFRADANQALAGQVAVAIREAIKLVHESAAPE